MPRYLLDFSPGDAFAPLDNGSRPMWSAVAHSLAKCGGLIEGFEPDNERESLRVSFSAESWDSHQSVDLGAEIERFIGVQVETLEVLAAPSSSGVPPQTICPCGHLNPPASLCSQCAHAPQFTGPATSGALNERVVVSVALSADQVEVAPQSLSVWTEGMAAQLASFDGRLDPDVDILGERLLFTAELSGTRDIEGDLGEVLGAAGFTLDSSSVGRWA